PASGGCAKAAQAARNIDNTPGTLDFTVTFFLLVEFSLHEADRTQQTVIAEHHIRLNLFRSPLLVHWKTESAQRRARQSDPDQPTAVERSPAVALLHRQKIELRLHRRRPARPSNHAARSANLRRRRRDQSG